MKKTEKKTILHKECDEAEDYNVNLEVATIIVTS